MERDGQAREMLGFNGRVSSLVNKGTRRAQDNSCGSSVAVSLALAAPGFSGGSVSERRTRSFHGGEAIEGEVSRGEGPLNLSSAC